MIATIIKYIFVILLMLPIAGFCIYLSTSLYKFVNGEDSNKRRMKSGRRSGNNDTRRNRN